MSQARPERADAARNRRAILAATEELLATHRPQDISIEQVAAVAGVGKGTVFHRFGNRTGLMTALMVERAQALTEAVREGPPPLGPGAPGRDRLLAFLDAVIEVVGRNKSLLTELAFSAAFQPVAIQPAPEGARDAAAGPVQGHEDHPVYRSWHGHVSALIAAEKPGADAEMIAHVLLGSLHSGPLLACLATEGPARPAAAVRALACAFLDSPRLRPLRDPRGGRVPHLLHRPSRYETGLRPPALRWPEIIEGVFDSYRAGLLGCGNNVHRTGGRTMAGTTFAALEDQGMEERSRGERGPEDQDLTRRQREILGFWRDYVRRNGYAPTYREIAMGVDLASTSSVSYQVQQLEKMGLISREAGRARAAKLRTPEDGAPGMVAVPLVGRIAAGKPILANDDVEEYISLPEQLVGKGDLIMLRVSGDSMINAAITDGDLVVVRRETDVYNGDIVAARLPVASDEGEATVKTLRLLDGHVWLMPQNPAYEPILGDKATIIGKVVSVLRRL